MLNKLVMQQHWFFLAIHRSKQSYACMSALKIKYVISVPDSYPGRNLVVLKSVAHCKNDIVNITGNK